MFLIYVALEKGNENPYRYRDTTIFVLMTAQICLDESQEN